MDAPSPSESSELSALIRAFEEIGIGAGAEVSCSLDTGVSGGLDTFCRFFGCGSMVDETFAWSELEPESCSGRFHVQMEC